MFSEAVRGEPWPQSPFYSWQSGGSLLGTNWEEPPVFCLLQSSQVVAVDFGVRPFTHIKPQTANPHLYVGLCLNSRGGELPPRKQLLTLPVLEFSKLPAKRILRWDAYTRSPQRLNPIDS